MENLKTCAQYGIFDCGCCVNTGNNTNCKNYKPIASNTEYDELIYSPRLLAKNYVKECKVGNKIINKFGDLKENTTVSIREYFIVHANQFYCVFPERILCKSAQYIEFSEHVEYFDF